MAVVAAFWATEVELAVALTETFAEVLVLAEVVEFDSANVVLLVLAVALAVTVERLVLLAVTSIGMPSSSTLGTMIPF